MSTNTHEGDHPKSRVKKPLFLVQIIGGILDLVMDILKTGNTAICFGQVIEEWQ